MATNLTPWIPPQAAGQCRPDMDRPDPNDSHEVDGPYAHSAHSFQTSGRRRNIGFAC